MRFGDELSCRLIGHPSVRGVTMQRFDVVVVGSGAGGLSAAIAAASAGRSVLLLEAAAQFGGYINPFSRHGYTFDTGMHFVGGCGPGGTFTRSLESLGIADRVRFVQIDPDCVFRMHFAKEGFEFRWPAGRDDLARRLVAEFPREEAGISRYLKALDDFRLVSRVWSGAGEWLDWIAVVPKLPWLLGTMKRTLGAMLDDMTRDPLLKGVLSAIWNTHGLPPSKASAFYHLAVSADYDGAYYPAGGSKAFRNALVARAKELGADLRKLSPVARISKSGGGFEVSTEGCETFAAGAVVSDADPLITYGRLLADGLVPRRMKERAEGMRRSMSMFIAFVGTQSSAATEALGGRVVSYYETADHDAMWDRMMASDDGVMLDLWSVISPSMIDPGGGHAPDGRQCMEIMAPATYGPFARWAHLPTMKRGEEYEAFKRGIGERLLERVERFLPGLATGAKVVEFATPITAESWVRAPSGACYGPEQGPDQIGPRRFQVTTPVSGLFLAGAGTYGGGISPCIMSGIEAGRKAARASGG